MPELLIFSKNQRDTQVLENLGKHKGFRVKSTFELRVARECLIAEGFDVLFADADLSLPLQEELAGLLWKKNPVAPFIIFEFGSNRKGRSYESRLFGAEVVNGEDCLVKLSQCLDAVGPQKLIDTANFSILVVEDLDSPREIICTYIDALGYSNVTGKASVREAIKELGANPDKYSCIFTDIRMPELGGKDLIEMIRNNATLRHIPIVVLTAYGTGDCLVDCLRAGASGFLVKPPKKNDILRELNRAQRINALRLSPRLTTPEEALTMQDALVSRGLM